MKKNNFQETQEAYFTFLRLYFQSETALTQNSISVRLW